MEKTSHLTYVIQLYSEAIPWPIDLLGLKRSFTYERFFYISKRSNAQMSESVTWHQCLLCDGNKAEKKEDWSSEEVRS